MIRPGDEEEDSYCTDGDYGLCIVEGLELLVGEPAHRLRSNFFCFPLIRARIPGKTSTSWGREACGLMCEPV